MAAILPCEAVELEICSRRNMNLKILTAFDSVCLTLGLKKLCIGIPVMFHYEDFKDCTGLLDSASLKYVNSFRTCFDNCNYILHEKINL